MPDVVVEPCISCASRVSLTSLFLDPIYFEKKIKVNQVAVVKMINICYFFLPIMYESKIMTGTNINISPIVSECILAQILEKNLSC